MHLCNYLSPELCCFKDIGLVNGCNFFSSLTRHIKGNLCNPLYLSRCIYHSVDTALCAIRKFFHTSGCAEVEASCKLPHNHDINTFYNLPFKCGCICQHRIYPGRPQIDKKPKLFS